MAHYIRMIAPVPSYPDLRHQHYRIPPTADPEKIRQELLDAQPHQTVAVPVVLPDQLHEQILLVVPSQWGALMVLDLEEPDDTQP